MSREVDTRPAAVGMVDATEREAELSARAAAASAGPDGQHVRIEAIDPMTGNASVLAVEDDVAREGDYVQRALKHLQASGDALGFEAEQAPEFAADPHVQRVGSGARTVHLQQLYKGIPIYGAARAIRFDPAGALEASLGRTVTVPENRPLQPRVTVQEAVRAAAEHVAVPDDDEREGADAFGEPRLPASVDLSGFELEIIAAFPEKAERPTVLGRGPFGDEIRASLVWFPLEELRLAWEVVLTIGDYEEQYRTVVDAETSGILFCQQLVEFASARGNVYRVDGGRAREMVDFPLALAEYGLLIPAELPDGFPDGWVGEPSTAGNAVVARLEADGPTLAPAVMGDSIVFDPADATGDDQKVLNIFFFNCVMHDYFYLLGFREREGNFQRDNFGRGGLASDPVDARAHTESVNMTASMTTEPADGSSPIMKMGPVSSTGRHTAFDSTVVFHEFMHGVTKRIVGGRVNRRVLDEPQSRGMGEGWGDYVACTINQTDVVGAWVKDNPGGIRRFRYDSNFPDSFEDLGKGRYLKGNHHAIGEIWCATLLEMNRQVGATLAMQLVFDALASPPNPSFLEMRDGILNALDARLKADRTTNEDHGAARSGIWNAFAKFGMGPRARSNGTSVDGVVPDFTPP